MIQNVVFSKGRPMQLEAYLESLFDLTNFEQDDVIVLINGIENYKPLLNKYSNIKWVSEVEGNPIPFQQALDDILDFHLGEENVLFTTDDAVCVRPFTKEGIVKGLRIPDVIGMSLRLGPNIRLGPKSIKTNSTHRIWKWTESHHHWGYPFDLTSGAYDTRFVSQLVKWIKAQNQPIRTPNFFEDWGFRYCVKNIYTVSHNMVSFNSDSVIVAQDINRVQDDYKNKHGGSPQEDSEVLLGLYNKGYRIDWTNLRDVSPVDPFVGRSYFKLKENNVESREANSCI